MTGNRHKKFKFVKSVISKFKKTISNYFDFKLVQYELVLKNTHGEVNVNKKIECKYSVFKLKLYSPKNVFHSLLGEIPYFLVLVMEK